MFEKHTFETYTIQARMRDVVHILVRELANKPIMQPEDVKERYHVLWEQADETIQQEAVGAKEFVDNLTELKRIALLMRVRGDSMGLNEFHKKFD